MVFTSIRTEILDRLGLTSSDSSTRVGRLINMHHRDLTASLGLNASRRTKVSATTVSGSNEVSFAGLESIDVVTDENSEPHRILRRVPYEEIVESHPESHSGSDAYSYAIKSQDAIFQRSTKEVIFKTASLLKGVTKNLSPKPST